MECRHSIGEEDDLVGVGLGEVGYFLSDFSGDGLRVGKGFYIQYGFGMSGREPFAEELPARSGGIGTDRGIENQMNLVAFNHINGFIGMLMLNKVTVPDRSGGRWKGECGTIGVGVEVVSELQ
jgi:hypothetical protein